MALGGFLGGQQFKSMGKLSDWHQLWFTSADSSGNGHRLNTSRPPIPQGACGGGSKIWGSCQTAGAIGTTFGTHLQIHLGMHIRQTNCPSRHKGALGGFMGQTFKSLGKLSNGWTDWHQIWLTSADSSGNGHRLNTIRHTITQGQRFLWDHKFKCLGKLSNGWSDWNKIWYKSADSPRNGHSLNTIRPSIPQGVLGGSHI